MSRSILVHSSSAQTENAVDGYRRNAPIKLLKADGEINGYCINCDIQRSISEGERGGLAGLFEQFLTAVRGGCNRVKMAIGFHRT
jgi:hypothetical protein